MVGQKWAIYWNEYSSDTYLYGSKLSFNKRDDVEFENLLMPPGTIIKQWYSKTNFQMQKIEPSLPMIDGESSYRIILNVDIPDGEKLPSNALCTLSAVRQKSHSNSVPGLPIFSSSSA